MKIKISILIGLALFVVSIFLNAPWVQFMSPSQLQITFLWGSFALFILMGVPISFSLGISAFFTALYVQLPIAVIFQSLTYGINSFAFVAIAFFILLGQIVNYSGMGNDLLDLANLLVGWLPGGLALVNILASMLFGGISGSSVADTASIGTVVIPMMEKEGYSREFATAITVTSSQEGIIIPPSQNMIIYSLAAGGVSVGALFMAGYIPGIILGLAQMLIVLALAPVKHFPKGIKVEKKRIPMILLRSLIILAIGFIVVGGIVFGFFTATESSSVGAALALVAYFAFYRKNWTKKNVLATFRESAKTSAMVLFLIANAAAFGYLMAYLQIPSLFADTITSISSNPVVILLMVNAILLALGLVMDMAPLIVIMTPILLPIVQRAGMDPIQFGIVMLINLGIGLCTPPVGNTLFVGCAVGKTTIEKVSKEMIPLYIAMAAVLLLITYVPSISMFLPHLFHLG